MNFKTTRNIITVRYSLLLYKMPVFLLFIVIYSNYTLFSWPYRLYMLILLGLLVYYLILFFALIGKRKIKIKKVLILYLILLFFLVFRNADIERQDFSFIVVFLIGIMFVFYENKIKIEIIKTIIDFHLILGVIASLVTVFCFLFPRLYFKYFFPLASSKASAELLYAFEKGYISGFANHYSSNGIFLSLFCGAAFSKLLNSKKRKKYIIYLLAGTFSLFLTAKRAQTVFTIAALYIVYYYFNSNHKKSRYSKMCGLTILLATLFFIVSAFVPQLTNVFERFSDSINKGAFFGERSELYAYALVLFFKRPLFGYGWCAYKYLAENSLGIYIAAHNVYIQLLAEIGLIGALFFYVFFVLSITWAIKNMKLSKKIEIEITKEKMVISCFSLFYISYFLMYSITGNALYESSMIVAILILPMFCYENIQSIKMGDNNG